MIEEYLVPISSYLFGSIPFGYILVKYTQGTDIRSVGSGNIGATNVYRTSQWTGILTLLLDGGKGYLAVSLAWWLTGSITWQTVAAVCAILGHCFSVWLRFRGGKGVATGCGAYLAIAPLAAVTALVVFILVSLLSRFISLGSILATAAFPILAYVYGKPSSVLIGAAIGSAVIIAKHHENIRRLLGGAEGRFAASNGP